MCLFAVGFLSLSGVDGQGKEDQTSQRAAKPKGQIGVVARFGHLIVDDGASVVAAVGYVRVRAHVFIANIVAFGHFFYLSLIHI